MRSTRVVAYRLPAETFKPYGRAAGYWLSREPVTPLDLVELGDLLDKHAEAGIELRIVPKLWPVWKQVIGSTLGFSGYPVAQPRRSEQLTVARASFSRMTPHVGSAAEPRRTATR